VLDRAVPVGRLGQVRGLVPAGRPDPARLRPVLRAHQIPPANRPGDIRWPGSNWSFTARISAAPGTGPHTSTALRTSGGAFSTTTLPRAGGKPAAGTCPIAARSESTNAATAAGSA